MKGFCSTCKTERARRGQRTCNGCHAGWMRDNRVAVRDMSPEQRRKVKCRSHSHMLVKRGKIKRKEFCDMCAKPGELQMHHPNYDKPLEVLWVHRASHLELHRLVASTLPRKSPPAT